MRVSSGIIHIAGREFIVVLVDHSAHDFELDIPRRHIGYNTYNTEAEFWLEDKYVHFLRPDDRYEIIGVYKELEEQQEFFRAELLRRNFNIDDNLFIIEHLD